MSNYDFLFQKVNWFANRFERSYYRTFVYVSMFVLYFILLLCAHESVSKLLPTGREAVRALGCNDDSDVRIICLVLCGEHDTAHVDDSLLFIFAQFMVIQCYVFIYF